MEQRNSSSASRPLRILSLDGGGIRGISSLQILGDIMEKIREARQLEHTPRPCEHFDLIGGTSTGGIIAIMLGRLGMTVDECISAYKKVAEQAFTPKQKLFKLPASPKGAFSATALESAIKQTVREFCNEVECVERRQQGHTTVETCPHSEMEFRIETCTKTVVLAITKDNVDTLPTLFTTYDTSSSFLGCKIWQVARATSAATTFFKSIKVGRDDIEFVDAGFGYNNPCEILIDEARRQFPGREQMRVLSIGTGLGEVVTIQDKRLSILKALKNMATSSKKVAQKLDGQYGDTSQYSRFNVERGLEDITLSDWEKRSTISTHTHNYLQENRRAVEKFVKTFLVETEYGFRSGIAPAEQAAVVEGSVAVAQELPGRVAPIGAGNGRRLPHEAPPSASNDVQAGPAAELGGTSTDYFPPPCHYIPLPENSRFVGREAALLDVQQRLFGPAHSRSRVAVVGLGGIGKTQVALQVAYWAKKNRPQYSVLWLPALSDTTFEQACTEIAKRLGIHRADDKDIKDTVRQYLSSDKARPWLLVVDNADDLDMVLGGLDSPGLIDYLPRSEHGKIMFTTRSADVAEAVAEGDVIKLADMDDQEALDLLEKCLQRRDLLSDKTSTTELLKELAYLPLAITQAAAYLKRNQIPISEYLGRLRGTAQDTIRLMSREFYDDSRYRGTGNAVATTWLVSFDQIRKLDNAAADLLMFMSHIEPKGIPRSILPSTESQEEIVHAIGTLYSYAFLNRRGQSEVYDMHSLVHLATRVWMQKHRLIEEAVRKAILHVAKVFPTDDHENRDLWREYMPHALKLVQGNREFDIEERYNLYFWIGRCLQVDGRIREGVDCLERFHFWKETTLVETHPDRLTSQHELAIAYQANGQVTEAVALLEKVVAIEEQTLVETHPLRLASQHTLAIAYQANGQVTEAVALLEKVVAIREQTLIETHPSRLASQHTLAVAYQANGQVTEAVALLEKVVAIREQILVETHFDRLASEGWLTYIMNNLNVQDKDEDEDEDTSPGELEGL